MKKRPYKVSLTAVIIEPEKKGEPLPQINKNENAKARLDIQIKEKEGSKIFWNGFMTFENDPESPESISIQDLIIQDDSNNIHSEPLNIPVQEGFVLIFELDIIDLNGFMLILSSNDSSFNSLPLEPWANK